MDIALLDMNARGNEGAWIAIEGPDGRPTDISVKIRGSQSDAVQKAIDEYDRRLAEAVKAKKGDAEFEALKKAHHAELAVASTIDWKGLEENGAPLPCTPETIRRFYLHPGYSWLVAQVYAKSRDAGVFLKP